MILLTNMTVQRGLTTEHSKYLISLNSHLAMEPKITILNKILKQLTNFHKTICAKNVARNLGWQSRCPNPT